MLRLQDRAALLRANAAAEARVADAVRAGTLAPAVGARRRARLWANRASLLLRAERWRTALKATATALRALREGGAAGEAGAGAVDPDALSTLDLRIRLALARGTALSHLGGKGKGPTAAAVVWREGMRVAEAAEADGLPCDVDLMLRLSDALRGAEEKEKLSPPAPPPAAAAATAEPTSANAATADPVTADSAPADVPASATVPSPAPAAAAPAAAAAAAAVASTPQAAAPQQSSPLPQPSTTDNPSPAASAAPTAAGVAPVGTEEAASTQAPAPAAHTDGASAAAPAAVKKASPKRRNKKKKKKKAKSSASARAARPAPAPALPPPPAKELISAASSVAAVAVKAAPPTTDERHHLSMGFMFVNTGKLAEANKVFDGLLQKRPSFLGALLGRGSANALIASRASASGATDVVRAAAVEAYKRALEDFSSAIKYHPGVADCYKRRGQVLAALGGEMNNADAVADLTKAIEITKGADPDTLQKRGEIYHRQRNFVRAVVDLQAAGKILEDRRAKAVAADPGEVEVPNANLATLWNALGLALNAMGETDAAARSYARALKVAGPGGMKEAWVNLGQNRRDAGDATAAEAAFAHALSLEPQMVEALHLRGLLRHGTGRTAQARDDLHTSLLFDPEHKSCRLMAGLVNQSLGNFTEALLHYATMLVELPSDSSIKFGLPEVAKQPGTGEEDGVSAAASSTAVAVPSNRSLAYYLAHLAAYFRASLDRPVRDFQPDHEVAAQFKEDATKRKAPKLSWKEGDSGDGHLSVSVNPSSLSAPTIRTPEWLVRLPANRAWLARATAGVGGSDVVFRRSLSLHPPSPKIDGLRRLLPVCDRWGPLIQLQCTGFLANRRQHRQFGMAVLAVAQAARRWWWPSSVAAAEGTKEGGGEEKGPPDTPQTYRELMDIAVRWRQVSEPNDPVWWIDLLTPASFRAGFGLQTPLVTGQTHVPRYYPYFARAIALTRELVLEQCTLSDAQRESVLAARSCAELYAALGGNDVWVCTTCARLSEDDAEVAKETAAQAGANEKEGGHGADGDGCAWEKNRYRHPRSKQVGVCVFGQDAESSEYARAPMEGTRLTLVSHMPEGHEFTIRMPGLPNRYAQFHRECTEAFRRAAVAAARKRAAGAGAEGKERESGGGTHDAAATTAVVHACATVFFYWVTWAPLTRGSAATGYVVLTALLLASGVELLCPPPKGVQADWEAILRSRPSAFVRRITSVWLGKPGAVRAFKIGGQADPLAGLPSVAGTLVTLRDMIECLNIDPESESPEV